MGQRMQKKWESYKNERDDLVKVPNFRYSTENDEVAKV